MEETIAFVCDGRMGANLARRFKDWNHRITAVY
jgi:6-phosphogluconate dehydrogenase (decarboxylating)